jgi:hypothetical protein
MIAFEELPALPADGLGADGGEFVAAVRLVECAVGNPESAQMVNTLEQLTFVREGADDQMGMRQVSRKK